LTKQEEVDRILIKYTGRTGAHLDKVKHELSQVGVVIKGQSIGGSHPHLANYYTVEPLIEE